jgi:hypothetical protein
MSLLTAEQKKEFLQYIVDYLAWISSKEGKKNITDHREHQKYFQERLSKKAIQEMDENQFSEVYKGLWASNIWGNKDWYVENKLLKPNSGFSFIKDELIVLFYDKDRPLSQRYNEFKKKVKGLGSSALTELLHFVFPDKYCLWNDKPKTVLPFLNLDNLLPENVFKYQITDGKDYAACNEVMSVLKNELVNAGIEKADFIDLDCYIWFIFIKKLPKRKRGKSKEKVETMKRKPEQSIKIESHPDGEYYLLKLGEMLGYITYTVDKKAKSNNLKLGDVAIATELPPFAGERDMNSARTIDVIWFGEDENPRYCFEVEHTMDILRSLNRLYQLKHFNVSFFVVSPEDKRKKFESEMNKFPFRNCRNRFHFISYDELILLYQNGAPFFELKNRLFGEK